MNKDHNKNRDVSDKKEIDAIKQKNKSNDDTFKEDIIWLMSNPRGRRIVYGDLVRCHMYETSFTGNSQTFFKEGERNVALQRLQDIIDNCPDKYMVMLEENQNRD